jgi:hypothetical protein
MLQRVKEGNSYEKKNFLTSTKTQQHYIISYIS